MDFYSASLLSGALFDLTCHGILLTKESIKSKLKDWIISDEVALALENQIQDLNITEDHSPKYIEKQLNASSEIISLLKKIKPTTNIINQTHCGIGDNIAGDKIINN